MTRLCCVIHFWASTVHPSNVCFVHLKYKHCCACQDSCSEDCHVVHLSTICDCASWNICTGYPIDNSCTGHCLPDQNVHYEMCITKCASRNVLTTSKQDACIPHPYNVNFVCIIEALDMCSMHFVYTGLNTPATLCSQDIHKRRTTNVFCVRSTSWQCARPFSNHDICNRHILHVVCNMFFCLGALFLSRRVCNMCTNVSWALPCARAQESPQSKLPMRRIAWID